MHVRSHTYTHTHTLLPVIGHIGPLKFPLCLLSSFIDFVFRFPSVFLLYTNLSLSHHLQIPLSLTLVFLPAPHPSTPCLPPSSLPSLLVINGFNLQKGRTLVPTETSPLPPVCIYVCQREGKKERDPLLISV